MKRTNAAGWQASLGPPEQLRAVLHDLPASIAPRHLMRCTVVGCGLELFRHRKLSIATKAQLRKNPMDDKLGHMATPPAKEGDRGSIFKAFASHQNVTQLVSLILKILSNAF